MIVLLLYSKYIVVSIVTFCISVNLEKRVSVFNQCPLKLKLPKTFAKVTSTPLNNLSCLEEESLIFTSQTMVFLTYDKTP